MPELSARAKKLLGRIECGRWYKPYSGKVPAAMKELVDAGLVTTCGRVVVIELAYVPTKGYTPFVEERYGAQNA